MFIFIPLIVFVILSNLFNIFPIIKKFLNSEKKEMIFIHINIIISSVITFLFLQDFNLNNIWIINYLYFWIIIFITLFVWWYFIWYKNSIYYFLSVIIQDICIFLILFYLINFLSSNIYYFFIIIFSFSLSHITFSFNKDFIARILPTLLFWILFVFLIFKTQNLYYLIIIHFILWILWKFNIINNKFT